MSKKFYHAQNAGRGIIGGARFQITEVIAGSAWGVYATEDPKEIEALDALVAIPTSAVTAIGEAEFEADVKKKPPTNIFLNSSAFATPQPPKSNSLKGPGVVMVVEGNPDVGSEPVTEIKSTIETVDEALSTGKVEVAVPIEGPPPEQTKRGEKRSRKS